MILTPYLDYVCQTTAVTDQRQSIKGQVTYNSRLGHPAGEKPREG